VDNGVYKTTCIRRELLNYRQTIFRNELCAQIPRWTRSWLSCICPKATHILRLCILDYLSVQIFSKDFTDKRRDLHTVYVHGF